MYSADPSQTAQLPVASILHSRDYFKRLRAFPPTPGIGLQGQFTQGVEHVFRWGIPGDPVYALYAEKQTEGMPPKTSQKVDHGQKK